MEQENNRNTAAVVTLTVLAYDGRTKQIGGASATGNLCVGAWVLRADPRTGISASQGFAASTFWGEDVLEAMKTMSPAQAISSVVDGDAGKGHRQLGVLDKRGNRAVFTGNRNIPVHGAIELDDALVLGNLLRSEQVLKSAAAAFESTTGALADRLLTALESGLVEGGDSRGALSAALKVVSPDQPPLDLRIDYSDRPLEDLQDLYKQTRNSAYQDWLAVLPTCKTPWKSP